MTDLVLIFTTFYYVLGDPPSQLPKLLNATEAYCLPQPSYLPKLLTTEQFPSHLVPYDGCMMTKTSITASMCYEFGSYTAPFTANPHWDGVRKLRYKTDVLVGVGWIEDGVQFEHLHWIQAYIKPEARQFVANILECGVCAANSRYLIATRKKTYFAVDVDFFKLGKAKQYFETQNNPIYSVFLHDPSASPSIQTKNYPRTECICPLGFDPGSRLWQMYMEYRVARNEELRQLAATKAA